MSKQDYYHILEINRNASSDEIKKAYRKLAMKYHPDRNMGDTKAESKFKEIQEAYSILSDSKKKALYDQYGHDGVAAGAGASGFGGGGGSTNFDFDIGDIFSDVFGSRARSNKSALDLHYELTINLEQAVKGDEVNFSINAKVGCQACDGLGASDSSQIEKCRRCGGVGQIRMQQGFFSMQSICPECRGQGQSIKNPCNSCHGDGVVNKNRNLKVKIPSGIDNGDQIRLSGEGEAGKRGQRSGDLYVHINIKPHSIFKRDGLKLYCDIPVNYVTACLGGKIEVPTIDSKVVITIPEGTQNRTLFSVKGKGIKQLRGSQIGDLLCRVNIEVPTKLNTKQKDLLRDFNNSLNESNYKKDSFFSRIKSWID